MTYIVHGATGAQGSPVRSALLSAGKQVVGAGRTSGIDLADADSLAEAYTGAAGVFVHLPMGPPAQTAGYAAAIALAVEKARPARVVISTSGVIVDEPGSPLQAPADHPLTSLIRRIEQSGVSSAVVAPRLYLENLLMPVIADVARGQGVLRYPLPGAFPVSWSSHIDVAEVVVRLLTDPTVTGTVAVGHLPALTGPDLAAGFAAHLGREVRFEAITPAVFGELITPVFGTAAATPVIGLYQALNTLDRNTIAEHNSAQHLLGLVPRTVEKWLAQLTG